MYNNNGLTFELVTANGNKITEFTKDGRTFVEGRKGSEYKIKVTNHSNTRIKVIISVDGLDIVTGKRATPKSGGYLIKAYDTETLEGWRISDDQVRKFFFTTGKQSYNNKTGNNTNNIGVIGVMAYKEIIPYSYFSTLRELDSGRIYNGLVDSTHWVNTSSTPLLGSLSDNQPKSVSLNAVTPSAASSRGIASVGTGMGEVKESKVTTVQAKFENSPFAVMEIFYKTRKELEAMGIKVTQPKEKPLPSAFAGCCKQV